MSFQDNIQNFYKGKRVCVTGHTGFKGSWISMWLHMLGADVLGIALEPTTSPSMFTALKLNTLIDSRIINIDTYEEVAKTIQDFSPDVVIHMAAQALVRPSYEDPLATLQSNIMGTAHVLEACRHTPSVRSIVIVTSDKCYQNNEWIWPYRENDPMGGYDPYSASKGCAELVTASYIKSFFNPEAYGKTHHVAVASARAGNAIGGGDWSLDRLIPDFFRALEKKEAVHIRYPSAIRPWQHAMECLSGYLLLGAKLYDEGVKYSGGWNFAPIDMGDVWPVERIIKFICKHWGKGEYIIDTSAQPHEATMLSLDCTKANTQLRWRPRYSVSEALEETVEWYKAWTENNSAEQMREVTRKQIQKYMQNKIEDN